MTLILLLAAWLWAGGARAQGTFTEIWDPVCTLGQDANTGCDAIRARKIVDAAQSPWRAIGRVNFASVDQRSHCTGVLVSERHVLTAAHCLFNAPRKRWIPAGNIRFAAGYQRGKAQAFSVARGYVLPAGQGETGDFNNQAELDWAILELSSPIGQTVGFLPLARDIETGFVVGYSGLRPHVQSRAGPCVPRRVSASLLQAICPVMMGDSGAPFLVQTGNGPAVVGILSRVAPTPQEIDALFLSVDLFDQVP